MNDVRLLNRASWKGTRHSHTIVAFRPLVSVAQNFEIGREATVTLGYSQW